MAPEDEEPRALVRRFSAQVAASDNVEDPSNSTLRRIIAGDYDRERLPAPEDNNWARHFQPWSPVSADEKQDHLLRPAAVKLSLTWNQFRDKVPGKDAASWQHRAPDFKDVFDLMNNLSSQFEKDRNRGVVGFINRHFRTSCEQLKAHESLLNVLPQGSEYVSLFAGVLKSIIQASCNHEKILAAFARSWAEISDKVSYLEGILDMYPTQKIQELMMSLYGNIFSYLNSALDWYMVKPWRRALKSFKEDLYEEHEDQISSICRSAQDIKDRALLGQGAQLHDIQHHLADLTRRFEQEQQRKRLDIPELRQQSKVELASFISSQFKGALQQIAADAAVGATLRLQGVYGRTATTGIMPAIAPTAELGQERISVSKSLTTLKAFFDERQVRGSPRPKPSTLPVEVTMRLQHWVTEDTSTTIAISGADAYLDPSAPGSLSSAAANLIAFVDVARLPVVSYFCTLNSPGAWPISETRESRALVALLYALIWQLVELLPSESTANTDLSVEEISSLDGTMLTFPEALDILRDVLQLAPPVLYCIIDGLHWLDDISTQGSLDSLLSLLLSVGERGGSSGKQFKVLFTTAGLSRALLRSLLPRQDQILLDSHRFRHGRNSEFRLY